MPVSVTSTLTSSSSTSIATSTEPSSGVYFTALSTMLSITRASSSGSPNTTTGPAHRPQEAQADPGLLGADAQQVDAGLAELGEVDGAAHRLAPALDARVVQEVGDEVVEPLGVADDRVERGQCRGAGRRCSSAWPRIAVSGVLSSWEMVAISSLR